MAEVPGEPIGGGAPPPPRARAPGWMRVVLVLSLAANLLIAGLIVGAALDRRGGDLRRPPATIAGDLGLGPYLRALPPELQRELGRDVRRRSLAGEAGRTPLRTELRRGFRGVLEELRSDAFDPQRLAGHIARQSGALEARRRVGQDAFVDVLSAMTTQERRAFADRLERQLRRPAHRN